MECLNPDARDARGVRRIDVVAPCVAVLGVRGKRLAVDVQTLLAHRLTGDCYPAPSPSAPNVPLTCVEGPRSMVLALTHACNLACEYCFVRNYSPDRRLPVMSMEIVRRALDLIPYSPKRRSNPDIVLSFFGGEPLVAFERLREAAVYAESVAAKRGVRIRFNITTNGTLITPEVADFISDHGMRLIVSLDGPADVHDTQRPMRGGSSQAATLRGLSLVRERAGEGGSPVTLRGTFLPDCRDLAGRLEYLNGLCDEGYAANVSVEPAYLTEDSCLALPDGHDLAFTLRNVKPMIEQYWRAADWFVARVRGGATPRFMHFQKFLMRLACRQPAVSDCGAGKGYISVGPEGGLYACHHEGDTGIGDVWRGIDEAARAGWLDNRHYARKRCPDCWARWLCGGGCREVSLRMGLSIREPDPVGCWFRKVWIRCAAWILSELTPEEVERVTAPYRRRR